LSSLRGITYKSRLIGSFLGGIATGFQFKLLYFYKEKQIIDLIKSIKNETNFAFYPYEAYTVYSTAKSQSKLDGEMVEVGVYQGGSAKLICEAKGDKKLHLFDTFEGLPKVSDKDTHFGTKYWQDNQFNDTSEEHVKKYLKSYNNVHLYKGLFPQTAEPISNSKFSFVHLDVDLYKSTIDCLSFFYPRMIQGGIILTHDYHTTGVQTAFKEFFSDKKIPIIELTGSQCLIVKTQ
jgi:hypothetical protein